MDCDQLEKLSLWLDGELPSVDEQSFADHLALCTVCSASREKFVRLRAELRQDAPLVNPFYQRRALDAILNPTRRTAWMRWVEVPAPVLLALVLVMLSFGWVALFDRGSSVDTDLTIRAPGSAPDATPIRFDVSRFDRGGRIVLQKIRKPAPGSTR